MTPSNSMCAVPNYGSSASYCDLPTEEQIRAGVVPLDSLPAAWWNAMWACTNGEVNKARDMLGQLIVELNSVLTQAGVVACSSCTDQLYQSIDKIRQTLANASVAGAVKSSSQPSEISVDANGYMSVNCLGNASSLTTSASTVVGAINELKSTYDCCFSDTATAIGGKAPTSHASSATTYGVGSADNYGHLKISDTYTSVLSACSGVAASQKAVACVYCYAAGIAAGIIALGNTAGKALGTAAAGTATTAARSDHVHPKQTCVECAGKDGSGCTFGTAARYACGCFRPSTWTPTCVTCAACVYHDSYTSSADRPIMVTSDTGTAAGYFNQGTVRSGCDFTYNPATGQLKLKSNGKTACISHQNASYLHIYTDAACIAFNQNIYLPSGKYIDRAKYACCATYTGSGTAFGSAAVCAATAFRSCTWWPNCLCCGAVCLANFAYDAEDACFAAYAERSRMCAGSNQCMAYAHLFNINVPGCYCVCACNTNNYTLYFYNCSPFTTYLVSYSNVCIPGCYAIIPPNPNLCTGADYLHPIGSCWCCGGTSANVSRKLCIIAL